MAGAIRQVFPPPLNIESEVDWLRHLDQERATLAERDRQLREQRQAVIVRVVREVGVEAAGEWLGLSKSRISQVLRDTGVSGRDLQRERNVREAQARRVQAPTMVEQVTDRENRRPGRWRTEPEVHAAVTVRWDHAAKG